MNHATFSDEVPRQRAAFQELIASNPNYFGNLPLTGFEPQDKLVLDETYERIACLSYDPARDRIEATVEVNLPFGYGGGPCTAGTFEYLRFYVNYGSGWEDAGPAAINVHDIPVDKDCVGNPTHPLSYVAGVDHTPKRDWCGKPVLPRIRAILSWAVAPPPNDPTFTPVWGTVKECRAQIRPRFFFGLDLVDVVGEKALELVPKKFLEKSIEPGPDPEPGPALDIETLAKLYAEQDVPQHRFAAPWVQAAIGQPKVAHLTAHATHAEKFDIDIAAVIAALSDAKGDTTFEEVHCVGLDEGLSALVASFEVKKSNGFNGGPCTSGSVEYVAFWGAFDDDECKLHYLGTAEVRVHDYELGKRRLCYAAVLPVDLGHLRRDCEKPNLRRVKAVLSWGSPPSTTDPDAVPFWGNAIERHVQIAPGRPYDGNARFNIVGGVAATNVSLTTGLTLPGALLGSSLTPLSPLGCPFAGKVELRGPTDPSLLGHSYRIVGYNLTTGGSQILTNSFGVVDLNGIPHTVTPDPLTGFAPWPAWASNTGGLLAVHNPGGDDLWEYRLELDVAGVVTSVARAQMDNLVRNQIVAGDTVNAADLTLNTGGACKVPHTVLTGTFVARDLHFDSASIGLIGGTGAPLPASVVITPSSTTTQTSMSGQAFSIDLSDPLIPSCGYVVRLTVADRAVVNSAYQGHSNVVDRGLCLE